MKKVITALTATAAISTYGLASDASANSESGAGAYSILSGDTLWSIAKTNGLTVDQLKNYNNLSSDLIHTGSQLNLSSPSTYTVKAGDTLWGIGNRHNVSVADLKEWNNLSSDLILVNQTLSLKGEAEVSEPVEVEETEEVVEEVEDVQVSTDTYTVKPGDTLYGIASEHGMTYRTLMSINGMSDYVIYPGDVLQLKGEAQPVEVEAPVEEEEEAEVEETVEAEEPATEEVVEEAPVEEAEEVQPEPVVEEEPVQEETEVQPEEEVVAEEEPEVEEAPVQEEEIVEEEAEAEAEEPVEEEAPAAEEEVEEAPEEETEEPAAEETPAEEEVVEEVEEVEEPVQEEEVPEEEPAVEEETEVEEAPVEVEEQPEEEVVTEEEPEVEETPVQEEVEPEETVEEAAPAEEEVVEEDEEVEEPQPEPSNITGDTYTVQSGDTLASIANRAGMNYNDIMTYNSMDSVLIYPGLTLDLVDNRPAEVEEPVQEEVSEPAQEETVEEAQSEPTPEPEPVVEEEPEPVVEEQAPAPSASYGTNWYPHGECTWYALERRQQLGKPASGSWGNAYNWDDAARSQGLAVNNTPSVGAIMQSNAWSNGAYSFGHVAVVEQVNADGSIMVSEMNWGNGLGNKSFRTLSATQAASHNFIH